MVGVHCMGRHNGIEYLVMEHVPGITLEAHLEQRKKVGDAFTAREALDILVAIADGLSAIHRAGIAHRDVKPSNILLAPGDRVVLTDFGLVVPEVEKSGPIVAGTPAYMAPEAFKNEVARGAGNLLDVYSFGVVAFETLAGHPPFESESALKLMSMHVMSPVPPLPESVHAPPALSELVRQMLSKDPRDRPNEMETVAGQLRAIRTALVKGADAPLTALVVDDAPDVAKLLGMYVRQGAPKAEVTIVHRAKDALEAIRKKAPQLLLLDLMMPGMSGVELFMYLRGARLAEDTTVVAVSAGGNDADIELLRELGVAHFVPKGSELRTKIISIVKTLAAR
jgi:serine/threonine-protein kinase